MRELRYLQCAIGVGSVVPIVAGASGMLAGTDMMHPLTHSPQLESHFRYLSGLLFGIGLGFITCIGQVERKTPRMLLLTGIVVAGGVGRLYGLFHDGNPGASMLAALAMELIITPLLCLWQIRIARNRASESVL